MWVESAQMGSLRKHLQKASTKLDHTDWIKTYFCVFGCAVVGGGQRKHLVRREAARSGC